MLLRWKRMEICVMDIPLQFRALNGYRGGKAESDNTVHATSASGLYGNE
jgi:hypothetical protein